METQKAFYTFNSLAFNFILLPFHQGGEARLERAALRFVSVVVDLPGVVVGVEFGDLADQDVDHLLVAGAVARGDQEQPAAEQPGDRSARRR